MRPIPDRNDRYLQSRTRQRMFQCAVIGLVLAMTGCQSLQSINPLRGRCCGGGFHGLFNRNRVIYQGSPTIVDDGLGTITTEPPLSSGTAIEVIPRDTQVIDPGFPEPALESSREIRVLPPRSDTEESGAERRLSPIEEGRSGERRLSAQPQPNDGDQAARRIPSDFSPRLSDPYRERISNNPQPITSVPRLTAAPTDSSSIQMPTGTDMIKRVSTLPEPGDNSSLGEKGSRINQLGTDQQSSASMTTMPPAEPAALVQANVPPSNLRETEVLRAVPLDDETPELPRLIAVAPQLAAGSFPDADGWRFLREKGYRTILDLRPISEMRHEDLLASRASEINHPLLPIQRDQLDLDTIKWFEQEINYKPARPLYFCDSDGTTSALVWYLYRVLIEEHDPDRALASAQQIATLSESDLEFAASLIEGLRGKVPAAEISASSPEAPSNSTAVQESTSVNEEVEENSLPGDLATASTAEVFANPFAEPEKPKAASTLTAWKPFAALALSIFVVPMAYWSGFKLPWKSRRRARASLQGPRRQPQSLPDSSDVGT